MVDRDDIVLKQGSFFWQPSDGLRRHVENTSRRLMRSWRLSVAGGFLAVVAVVGERHALGDESARPQPGTLEVQDDIWPESNRLCRQNCLYVMLRMKGIPADYKRLTASLSGKAPDISLTDLERIGRRIRAILRNGPGRPTSPGGSPSADPSRIVSPEVPTTGSPVITF